MTTPSYPKISTITATGSLNTVINLPAFYEHVDIVPYHSEELGFIYIEYGLGKDDTMYRGFNKKLDFPKRKRKASKRFDNQVTVILRYKFKDQEKVQQVNIKVFKNGNVQMTGVKEINQGEEVIEKLVDQIRSITDRLNIIRLETKANIDEVAHDIDLLKMTNYKICLINSDFRLGIEVKRDKLNKIIQNEYMIYSSFEPCIYPGVKIQYCWNSYYGNSGQCKCSSDCLGKGNGFGEGQCKRITIAVFQSGCIIITGAQTYSQIDDAYKFICKVIDNHRVDIQKIKCVIKNISS